MALRGAPMTQRTTARRRMGPRLATATLVTSISGLVLHSAASPAQGPGLRTLSPLRLAELGNDVAYLGSSEDHAYFLSVALFAANGDPRQTEVLAEGASEFLGATRRFAYWAVAGDYHESLERHSLALGREVVLPGDFSDFSASLTLPDRLIVRHRRTRVGEIGWRLLAVADDGSIETLREEHTVLLGTSGALAYFVADEGIWRTDGTGTGTTLVGTLPGPESLLDPPFVSDGNLFFGPGSITDTRYQAMDLTTGEVRTLWEGSTVHAGRWFEAAGGAFVIFDDGVHGHELWFSDGSDFRRLTDFANPSPFHPSRRAFVEDGDRLFFLAEEAPHERGLWILDRATGMQRFVAAADQSQGLVKTHGGIVFVGISLPGYTDTFSITDGDTVTALVEAERVRAVDLEPVQGAEGVRAVALLTTSDGLETWFSDGTPSGTWKAPETPPSDHRPVAVAVGPDLLLVREEGVLKVELEGSQVVADVGRATSANIPRVPFAVLEGLAVEVAPEGPGRTAVFAGRQKLERRFELEPISPFLEIRPGNTWAQTDTSLYFVTHPGSVPWRTDGTEEGTWVVQTPGYEGSAGFRALDGDTALMFRSRAFPGSGRSWFLIDETGPRLLVENPLSIRVLGDEVCWSHALAPPALLTCHRPSDGSTRSFQSSIDLDSVELSGDTWIHRDGERFYRTYERGQGASLLLIEVAAGDLVQWHVVDGERWAISYLDGDFDDQLIFVASDAESPARRVLTLPTGPREAATTPALFGPTGLYFLGGALPAGGGYNTGDTLWFSDGTEAGTRQLPELRPGPESSAPSLIGVLDGALLLTAESLYLGRELWTFDLEREEFRLVRDLAPGPLSSHPTVQEIDDGTIYLRAFDGLGVRTYEVLKTGEACDPSAEGCVSNSRFQVEVDWSIDGDHWSLARSIPLTEDTVSFWFLEPGNLEIVSKLLDGTPINQHHWLFYASLTNLDYVLTVVDRDSGGTNRYRNPAGAFHSDGDTRALALTPDPNVVHSALPSSEGSRIQITETRGEATECQNDESRICFAGRFLAEFEAVVDPAAGPTSGRAVELVTDTGAFWILDEENLEMVVKVLDGSGVNQHWWVFFGGLSNLEFRLRVQDTSTGLTRVYENPAGEFASLGDVTAFPGED
ncbi:MAG: hypothetical protein DWQ36_07140 [Acidobacteria bacterium]|nr:MAG: hypothetical protein DWQ36_07140 [Acidobacteriota bacterium]